MRLYLTSFCAAFALAQSPPEKGWVNPLVIKGSKFFDSVTGTEFRIKGVALYPRANSGEAYNANSVDWFTDDKESIWRPYLANLEALGVNTIRMYAVDPSAPHGKFMCELSQRGMYAFVGMSAVCPGCYIADSEAPACYSPEMFTRAQMIYNAFAVYDNVIGFSVGNENNLGKMIEKSAPCVKALIRDVRAYSQKCTGYLRNVPIGLDNADVDTPTHPRKSWFGYYDCVKDNNENTRAEWIGFNPYVECDATHKTYASSAGLIKLMNDYKDTNYARPIVFGEFGCVDGIVNTIDTFEQQRNFYDAKWMNTEPDMTEWVAGGIAFEFSVEKANLKKAATVPFAEADPGKYGIGYFSPDNCDHDSVKCVYNKYPEFDNLASAYNNTPASTIKLGSFTPRRTSAMACPSDFPSVALPPLPAVPILECSVEEPVCNGGKSNVKKGDTRDDTTTVAPAVPIGKGGGNGGGNGGGTGSDSSDASTVVGSFILPIIVILCAVVVAS